MRTQKYTKEIVRFNYTVVCVVFLTLVSALLVFFGGEPDIHDAVLNMMSVGCG